MGVPLNYNIRNLIERKGTTLMTAVGIALTVAVLVTAMALTAGLKRVFEGSGDPRNVLVLRKGVNAELSSTVSTEAYQIIRQMPGIEIAPNGEAMVSTESLTVVNLPSVEAPEGMNVTVRGLLPIGLAMREISIVEGKMLQPGLRQIVVGESIARRYPDARIGKQVRFGRGFWEVVGVFRVGETAANSEIWVDLNQLRGDFDRAGHSSSLLIRANISDADATTQMAVAEQTHTKALAARKAQIKSGSKEADLLPIEEPLPEPLAALRKSIDADQRLGSSVIGEKKYY